MRLSFILVENTEIDLYIASKLINGIAGEVVVEKFLSSEDALEHIAFEKTKKADRTIILLDLMMPRLNGADFISLFEALPDRVKDRYQIVIVTSSMNRAELDRLSKRRNVEFVIEKPLTREKFKFLLEQIQMDVNEKEV